MPTWLWDCWFFSDTLTLRHANLTVRLLIFEWHSHSQTCQPDRETVDFWVTVSLSDMPTWQWDSFCWVRLSLSDLPPWQWDCWLLSDTLTLRTATLTVILFYCWMVFSLSDLPDWEWYCRLLTETIILRHGTLTLRLLIVEGHSHPRNTLRTSGCKGKKTSLDSTGYQGSGPAICNSDSVQEPKRGDPILPYKKLYTLTFCHIEWC